MDWRFLYQIREYLRKLRNELSNIFNRYTKAWRHLDAFLVSNRTKNDSRKKFLDVSYLKIKKKRIDVCNYVYKDYLYNIITYCGMYQLK